MATSIRADSLTATAAVHVREPPMSMPTTGWPRRGGAGRLNTRCSSATRNKRAPAPSPSGPRFRRRAAKDEAATGSVRAASTSRRMPSLVELAGLVCRLPDVRVERVLVACLRVGRVDDATLRVRHRRAAKHLEGMQGIGRPAARGEVATDVV